MRDITELLESHRARRVEQCSGGVAILRVDKAAAGIDGRGQLVLSGARDELGTRHHVRVRSAAAHGIFERPCAALHRQHIVRSRARSRRRISGGGLEVDLGVGLPAGSELKTLLRAFVEVGGKLVGSGRGRLAYGRGDGWGRDWWWRSCSGRRGRGWRPGANPCLAAGRTS